MGSAGDRGSLRQARVAGRPAGGLADRPRGAAPGLRAAGTGTATKGRADGGADGRSRMLMALEMD